MNKIYVAILQRPMASLDETNIEVFLNIAEAQEWVDRLLADDDAKGGYSEDEMNWGIFERTL